MQAIKHTTSRFKTLFLLMFFSLLLVPGSSADIDALKSMQDGIVNVVEKAAPGVVYIEVEKVVERPQMRMPFEFFDDDMLRKFFGPQQERPQQRRRGNQPTEKFRQQGQGSGFIISADGYILTNHHVVGEADNVFVTLSDKREFEAKVIGSDPQTDVAVIKIEADESLPTIPLGNSEDIKVGQFGIAIGSPFGLSHSVTTGIISAKGRSNFRITDYDNFIQTDAAINPGNSGGPLLNVDGEAIGMNTAIISRSGGYMGIGFAIPINMAKTIFDQLKEHGKITRSYLGIWIQDLTPQLAESFDLDQKNGIVVSEIIEDSPADKSGLQSGDIVVALNGKPVKDTASFRNTIALTPPNTEIELTVIRDGSKETVDVTLEEKPAEVAKTEGGQEISKTMGFTVQTLTDELAERLGFENEKGVVVTEVDESSNAFRAGLRPGVLIKEINRQDVTDMKTYRQAVKEAEEKGSILLLVKSQEGTAFITFEME